MDKRGQIALNSQIPLLVTQFSNCLSQQMPVCDIIKWLTTYDLQKQLLKQKLFYCDVWFFFFLLFMKLQCDRCFKRNIFLEMIL